MSAVQRTLKSLFTSKDNETQDIIKWLSAISFLVAIGLTIWQVIVLKKDFDIMVYTAAVGILMGSTTAALRFKTPADPAADNTPTTLVYDSKKPDAA